MVRSFLWEFGVTMIPMAGGMAERFKAAVLKTVDRKVRGFESLSLRHFNTVNY